MSLYEDTIQERENKINALLCEAEESEHRKQSFIEWLEKEATANAGWMEGDFLAGVLRKAKEML